MNGLYVLDSQKIQAILKSAALLNCTVDLSEVGSPPVLARIRRVRPNSILTVLENPNDTLPYAARYPAPLRFSIKDYWISGRAQFRRSLRPDGDSILVELHLPEELESRNGRKYARVTLPDPLVQTVQIETAYEKRSVQLLDLAHAGVRIACNDGMSDWLISGTECQLSGQVFGTEVQMDGIVIWESGQKVGLALPSMRNVSGRQVDHPWVEALSRALVAVTAGEVLEKESKKAA